MSERRYLHLNLVANDINLHQGAYAYEREHGIAERSTFERLLEYGKFGDQGLFTALFIGDIPGLQGSPAFDGGPAEPITALTAIAQHTRAKLEIFGDALFMVLYSPIRKDGRLEFVETQLFAGKGYVISARYGNSAPYSTVRQRCEARPLLLEHGEDFVLYALMSFVIENYRPLLDCIHGELEDIEEAILGRPLQQGGIAAQKQHRRRCDALGEHEREIFIAQQH